MEARVNEYFARILQEESMKKYMEEVIDSSLRDSLRCLKETSGHSECPLCKEFYSLCSGAASVSEPSPACANAAPTPSPAATGEAHPRDEPLTSQVSSATENGVERSIPVSITTVPFNVWKTFNVPRNFNEPPTTNAKELRDFDRRMDRKFAKQLTKFNKGKGKYKNLTPDEFIINWNQKAWEKRTRFIKKLQSFETQEPKIMGSDRRYER